MRNYRYVVHHNVDPNDGTRSVIVTADSKVILNANNIPDLAQALGRANESILNHAVMNAIDTHPSTVCPKCVDDRNETVAPGCRNH
jgi:hypothetical protein